MGGSYPSAEMQSVYSIALADWVRSGMVVPPNVLCISLIDLFKNYLYWLGLIGGHLRNNNTKHVNVKALET